MPSNDNHFAEPGADAPDAHGEAAMLLVESLIHGLIARDVITPTDAVEIVEIAAEVEEDIAVSVGEIPVIIRKSRTLLRAVADSLALDVPGN